MFHLDIEETELFDEKTQSFVIIKKQTLNLEHSLISLSKWESKWKKPFYSKEDKTAEETLDYIKFMTLNPKVDPAVYNCLTEKHIKQIIDYIQDKMTATTFTKDQQRTSREIITSEIIYYWMIQCQIPFECEKWHLNRLLTLIEVCSRKNAPPKKMSSKELANRNRSLNAMRRAKTGSRG